MFNSSKKWENDIIVVFNNGTSDFKAIIVVSRQASSNTEGYDVGIAVEKDCTVSLIALLSIR